ncbi:uroporphyrinogen decarboxylase [Pseudoalteromonas lipolytica]|jgi:uroporphyrinogen decarboxylase|uniref:Uroporphyrinogen decarboxylase n=2 Tax=Pseudoalteromonas lipolytica TaxID=570156 RepID=A0AAD0WE17_9GAMM|nr:MULTISPECIES: uroporphyrinogen decarboxylase [Pseudoalteromonas]AXV66636.1 uroporphyrinogen decarboxylase [Pseudoalteromonas donghaensis]EWH04764.1 uroporphyrinogen decarboxylase [Pseudoalteromonas lipolytica SCSIO 04301]MBE0349443.1 uroporphyrinogen decarboxylase [Pseudoalteromonas lipolytica LMEB 39]MCC9661698.1 uroporphyrinogen decarboxylase [Pseudoalteromonas sp. MB41]QLJ08161.1 uroporphyrinogen decarboxylase [Pseudoalteromonas sp. JSTW]
MSELKNDRYLRALQKQPVDVTPVWMMRQAGRYLPEYRATRAQAGDFMSLCKNAELACEVTLQPLRRYPLDAAILFSDILTIPDAMGLGLYFETGEGPKFERPISSLADVKKIPNIDPTDELGYVMNAVSTIRRELKGEVPLIGFSGSPWTLATYMVEGGSSKTFGKIKKMAFAEPQTLHLLLDKLADSVIDYLNAQVKAGAQSLMVFDSWGGVLSPRDYNEFSLQYMHKIVDGLIREYDGRKVPVTLFTKNGGQWIEAIAATGCDAVGLDWTINIGDAKRRVGDKVALQGNMDPSMLHGTPERIRQEVATILEDFGTGSGHVFNLGHGITPDVDPEHAGIFINSVHELSAKYHK